MGTSSRYGASLTAPYYWALAPNYDFTLTPKITSKQGPLVQGEWRHRLLNGSYTVRAIFDDAANIISGENVKIDGVKVGTVKSVTPTPQAKAAVVLDITTEGFKDFRADASCTIRPQALLGEKFVDCLPTQPRVEGTPLPPPLKKVPSGREGAGQYLLPVTGTHSPDDTLRQPAPVVLRDGDPP